MTRIFHWLFMWKIDPMSGFDIRLVFTLPPSDSTLQYKRCVHFWNNFPCITSLVVSIKALYDQQKMILSISYKLSFLNLLLQKWLTDFSLEKQWRQLKELYKLEKRQYLPRYFSDKCFILNFLNSVNFLLYI